jgi:hypothetical protein
VSTQNLSVLTNNLFILPIELYPTILRPALMTRLKISTTKLILLLILFSISQKVAGQRTQIRGFVAVSGSYQNDELGFGIGEQDLFITSELNDDFSFLGETVFRSASNGHSPFEVSVERIIVNYNFKGNHSALIGKHHTPTHYWNDTYHHGRVFFPTIDRPIMFAAYTFPLHTTGVAMTGLNLGKLRFGYNVMLGNGIGSSDVVDNDKHKSLTAAIHIKPRERLQVGISFYHDVISEGAEDHGRVIGEEINQKLYTATIANFGSKFEFLAEGTYSMNRAQSTGVVNAFTSYVYTGWRFNEKWIPYVRFDYLTYDQEEIFYQKNDTSSILVGLRYEISYLIALKMEFQYLDTELAGTRNVLNAQLAIGF